MAKNCSICGKKLKLFDGKIIISDGIVCASCWASAGFDMGFKTIATASSKTSNQMKDLIEIEILKREAAKAGLKQKVESAKQNLQEKRPAKRKNTCKPIDIIIEVDDIFGVEFKCEGHPMINFEDLINGNEMIIGDGFVINKTDQALPDIHIECDFFPAIVDSGEMYYEEGIFTAGIQGRFDIDDPPVNLEEYAKIKVPQKGEISFTLYMGDEKIGSQECEMMIQPAPEKEMQKLMKAVLYEEEKNASGPVNVFLYARESGTYDIDLMRNPELLYSMYSNGKEQLIGDVYVANKTSDALNNIQFETSFTSDLLSPIKVLLGNVPAGEKICFEVDDPAINVDKLEKLTEIETCTATYKISVDGTTVAESQGKITICPYNQWNGALLLLPAYMTPNHPSIVNILQKASKWMLKNGIDPSLEGYQSNAKRVEEMVRGVYQAIKEEKIFYSNPPASFFGPQRIRLSEEVLEKKFATCLDITILFTSCLESFGLHPVLLTAPGHIFAGVWLTREEHLEQPILANPWIIKKYIEDGKMAAIECTAMNVGKNVTYESAKKIALNTIKSLVGKEKEDHECIDVQLVRKIGVKPLPIRISHPIHENTYGMIPEEVIETSNNNVIYQKENYRIFDEDLSHITSDNFYEKETKKIIKDAIAKIVAVEGPISQPELVRVIIHTTGLGRASKQISEHLDKLIATADLKITRQNGVRFLWEHGTDATQYLTYRVKNQRNPENICKYELKNAVCYLLQEQGSMTKEELTKALIHLFGYNRSSKKIDEGIINALKNARELKAIEKDSEGKYVLASK